MDDKINKYRIKIEEYLPGIQVKSVKATFDHGLHNDLMLINNELMVRFAKIDFAKDLLENEFKCIKLLRNKTTIPVPKMERLDYGVVSYPYIHGEQLFRHRLLGFETTKQKKLIGLIGDYLRQMQEIPLEDIRKAGINVSPASTEDPSEAYERLVTYYDRVKKELYPKMRAYTRACIDAAFRGVENGAGWFDYKPCLIHGDLALEHIIVDEGYSQIVGILDFGVAGTGSPVHDLAVLLDGLGEGLMSLMADTYPGLENMLARARVGLCSAGWHLRGIDTGDVFWHLVHLMTAKDIRY